MSRYWAVVVLGALVLGVRSSGQAQALDGSELASAAAAEEARVSSATRQVVDEEPLKLIYVGVFFGGVWPVGNTNERYDPSFMTAGRAEVRVHPLVRVGYEMGFYSMDADRPETADNQGAIALALTGRVLGTWGPYHPWGLAGLGIYNTKEDEGARRWNAGFQIGGGVDHQVTRHLAVTTGIGMHWVPRSGINDLLWIDGYLGFVFTQPY